VLGSILDGLTFADNFIDMEENLTRDEQNSTELRDGQDTATDIPTEESGKSDNQTVNLQQQIEELKDKYLRLVADFDNFRKRTARERLDLIQTASKDVITSLLPVLDDSERAEKQIKNTQDVEAVKEGIALVFTKLRSALQSKGLKPMVSVGQDFNPEFHEAITEVPAPQPELKGTVLDEVEKGYYLNDKIIRFAKVVVGK
jgi:molecular chaperone GrpE